MVKEQTLKIGCIFYYAKKFMHNYCIFDIKHPGKNISYFYQINFSDFQGHERLTFKLITFSENINILRNIVLNKTVADKSLTFCALVRFPRIVNIL